MPNQQTSAIRILHLSDLHFGTTGQADIWKSLKNWITESLRPQLVLVTGDIVDTPNQDLYDHAKTELDGLHIDYIVCPGNHDHHTKGNAIPGLDWFSRLKSSGFYTKFHKKCNTRLPISLRVNDNAWNIGLLTLDSSKDAKYSAQGFLNLATLDDIDTAVKASRDADLMIALVHHHLLPIPGREYLTQRKRDLLGLTTMVNAGLCLERLAHKHVDLVLHGHEHCRHVARYGIPGDQTSNMVVLGAGSSCGVQTLRPCSLGKASCNLIELHADRSVWLKEIRYEEGEWKYTEPGITLFHSNDLSRSTFLRSFVDKKTPPKTHWVKHIQMTSDRNGIVREYRSDWNLTPPKLTIKAVNSTGTPVNPKAKLDFGHGPKSLSVLASGNEASDFSPLADEDHAWGCEFSLDAVPGSSLSEIHTKSLELEYTWDKGALLTQEDLSLLNPTKAGAFRRKGLEFVGIRVADPIQSLTLHVSIPRPYLPRPHEVFVYNAESHQHGPKTNDRLQKFLRTDGNGTFSLRIAYPKVDSRYYIAWKVPPRQSPSPLGERFLVRLHSKAFDYCKCFHERLLASVLPEAIVRHSAIALYTDKRNPASQHPELECISYWAPKGKRRPDAPVSLTLDSEKGFLTQSWWGSFVIAAAKEPARLNEVETNAGFLPTEKVLVTIPIGLDAEPMDSGAVPWAILRLSIYESTETGFTALLDPDASEVDAQLAQDRLLLLQYVLRECSLSSFNTFLAEE